jgi:predicted nucleotidyltransferase
MFRLSTNTRIERDEEVASSSSKSKTSSSAIKAKRKFLRYFPKGYADQKYYDWERGYKWEAHLAWQEQLSKSKWRAMLAKEQYEEIAAIAVRIESKTNLLFSFEKMALRDAVKTQAGAKIFAEGLFKYLYGAGSKEKKFDNWVEAVESLPRKQTRVLTWPLLTVFAFIAMPEEHIFLKPNVTRVAAEKYEFDFRYRSRPNWDTYQSLLDFAEQVRKDMKGLKPKDMIDLQSFIWVQGSDEYSP